MNMYYKILQYYTHRRLLITDHPRPDRFAFVQTSQTFNYL